MAVVLHEAQMVFLATPHSASRAVAQALIDLGGEASAKHHDTLAEVRAQGLMGDPTGYQVFTTVRHHFDALVTWWFARGRGRSFHHFLLLLTTLEGQVRDDRLYWKWFDDADVVLRYESLEVQLGDAIEARLGRRPTLRRIGVSHAKRDWREYYDPASRRLVEDVFARELDSLGYGWDLAGTDLEPILRCPAWRR